MPSPQAQYTTHEKRLSEDTEVLNHFPILLEPCTSTTLYSTTHRNLRSSKLSVFPIQKENVGYSIAYSTLL